MPRYPVDELRDGKEAKPEEDKKKNRPSKEAGEAVKGGHRIAIVRVLSVARNQGGRKFHNKSDNHKKYSSLLPRPSLPRRLGLVVWRRPARPGLL